MCFPKGLIINRMSLIKILPENLVNQIAAGEVVERPASVVKELVENSLDAGADSIVVELKDAGKTLIKVSDNGCGIAKDELTIALQRHATSKISDESDLWKIKTMGFRGEALASISSVSKLVIRSKRNNDLSGAEIHSDGGEIVQIKDVGMNQGTQIEVRNLFFNTPARQKYLKQDSTELGHVSAIFNTIALANPGKSFRLIHNEKTISSLPKVTDLISRISDIFGSVTAEAMIPIFYGGSDFQIDGFIGKPLLSRSTGQHQYFFVNGRPIQHFLLANTIKTAFHSMLMENKKPVFVLNMKIDPSLIDVNVHPRKTEIRFEDQQTIIKVVYGCTKTALEKTSLIPKGFTESRRYMSDGVESERIDKNEVPQSSGRGWSAANRAQALSGQDVQEALSFSRDILGQRDVQIKSISQIANSYIVAEDKNGLVLIDQHAAHERIRYEELMDQFENQKKSVQPLLVPEQMELSSQEINLIEENKNIFEQLGFEIEPFGGNTFIVNAVPSCLAKEDVYAVIKGVLDDISNQKNPSKMQGRVEEILTYMSCRSAIKFGKSLSQTEMQALILQMEKLKRPYTCPHGRPTMIALTLGELDKMFGRK